LALRCCLPASDETEVRARLEQEVLPAFAGRILPFDVETSETYANLMAQAQGNGRAIGKADAYIATTAASQGLFCRQPAPPEP
jgi:predicted nucleic acid-binding protein